MISLSWVTRDKFLNFSVILFRFPSNLRILCPGGLSYLIPASTVLHGESSKSVFRNTVISDWLDNSFVVIAFSAQYRFSACSLVSLCCILMTVTPFPGLALLSRLSTRLLKFTSLLQFGNSSFKLVYFEDSGLA